MDVFVGITLRGKRLKKPKECRVECTTRLLQHDQNGEIVGGKRWQYGQGRPKSTR